MTTDSKSALYVYGFTRPGIPSISAPGVDGGEDVTTLELGDIAAVVSPLSMEDMVGPGDPAMDLEWVAPRALRHQQVVEEVMQMSTVLPLTFGVVFSSEQALVAAVGPHEARIREFLDYAADKQEWAVKVYADARRIREALEQSQRLRERLERLPASPGARYLQKKRLDRELDVLAADERREMAEQIREALASEAVDVRILRIPSRELTGRSDEVVLNSAFLARLDHVERFVAQVEHLTDEYGPRGLTIEASGPWPPYSFSPSLQVAP